jgi:hypothetical protein
MELERVQCGERRMTLEGCPEPPCRLSIPSHASSRPRISTTQRNSCSLALGKTHSKLPNAKMASSNRKTLRFAVGSPEEYRSAIWRLFVQGDDVYLQPRHSGFRSDWKFSLHRSGVWRLAYTKESGYLLPGSSDRVTYRWTRPAAFRPGWVQGPSIVVPYVPLKTPNAYFPKDVEDPAAIHWTTPPDPGYNYDFIVLLAAPEAAPLPIKDNELLLGPLDLRKMGAVHLLRRYRPMTAGEIAHLAPRVDPKLTKVTFTGPAPAPHFNASAWETFPDASGGMNVLDLPFGREHATTKPQ